MGVARPQTESWLSPLCTVVPQREAMTGGIRALVNAHTSASHAPEADEGARPSPCQLVMNRHT